MTNKIIIKIIALTLIIFLITGCTNILNTGKNTKREKVVLTGTKGLELSFLKNAPPAKVFEGRLKDYGGGELKPIGDPFKAIVKIQNIGAYDIDEENPAVIRFAYEQGYVDFIDIEEPETIEIGGVFDTELDKKSANFFLKGRSLINSKGNEIEVVSNFESRQLVSLSTIHSSSMFASVCYPYQTRLSTSVCIDPDVYGLSEDLKACEAKSLTFAGGQAAPLAITKVDVRIVPVDQDNVRPEFVIYVRNVGGGEVVFPGYHALACSSEFGYSEIISLPDPPNPSVIPQAKYLYKNFNVISVNLEESFVSDKKLECKSSDFLNEYFQMTGKDGIIRCTGDLFSKNTPAYQTPLIIVIDYGYTQTISKSFDIMKLSS